MVEGCGLTQALNISHYPIGDICRIMQDFLRGYPDRFDTLLRQITLSPFIAFRSITHIMRHAVDFDRQFCRRTIEIQYIRAERMLTTELDAQRFPAELLP